MFKSTPIMVAIGMFCLFKTAVGGELFNYSASNLSSASERSAVAAFELHSCKECRLNKPCTPCNWSS